MYVSDGGSAALGAQAGIRRSESRPRAARLWSEPLLALQTAAGPAAVIGVLATTTVLALAAARTGGLLPETMRPAPATLTGPLGSSVHLGNASLIMLLVAGYACYVLAAAARQLDTRLLVGAIVLVHVLVVLAPPLFSTDMFSYQDYARLGALHGVNPYLAGPMAARSDPLYGYVGFKWLATPTVYGPLFTALTLPLASLSIAASAWVYKSIAALASLLILALVWKIARLRCVDPGRALVLVGLNPLLVLYGVGGGHNDLLMLLPLVGGIYLALRERPAAAGASLIAAAAIKLAGGLPLLFALAARRPGASRPVRRLLLGSAVGATACVALGAALFGPGMLRLLDTLEQVQSEGGWHSLPGFVVKALHLGAFHNPISIGLGIACLVVCLLLARRVWQGRLEWVAAAGWAVVAVLLSASSLLPWYVVWLLPLAAVAGSRRLRMVSVLLTGLILAINLIDYLPHPSFVWSL